MTRRGRWLRGSVTVLCVVVASACGGAGAKTYSVKSDVVFNGTSPDIHVFSPDTKGAWPYVLAFHGVDGNGSDMAELGTRLAKTGVVVFAPTYGTDMTTVEGTQQGIHDSECGYRYSRTIADQYGADLRRVTFVGWSLGASVALAGGLTEAVDRTATLDCFSDVPRADTIVAISGCYYEHEGSKYAFDVSGYGNKAARIVLVAGDEDTTCAAWQSHDAAEALRNAGYTVELVTLQHANHFAPVYHDLVDGKWLVITDDPAGDRTVDVILRAIAGDQNAAA